MTEKVIVSFSGGMDSTTLLSKAVASKKEVRAVGFCYGSKHNKYENEAAKKVAEHYGIHFRLIDLTSIMENFASALMKSGPQIPEGHYEEKSMSLTVVPGRNLIFISILSGIAWSEGAQEVLLGIHSGDHLVYPDCRPKFFEAANWAVQYGTDERVSLRAPYLHMNKTSIIAEGMKLKTPYSLTRTCYKDQEIACGKCGSCNERREAFQNNNIIDPIRYEYLGPLPAKSA